MKNTVKKQKNTTEYRFAIIAVCVFYALYFASIPIYLSVASNVRYIETALPVAINFLGKALEVCGIAAIYAISLYLMYRIGDSAIGISYATCGISAAVKCIGSQVISWLMSGGIPAFNNHLLEESIFKIVLPVLFELLQFTVFLFIARKRIAAYRESYEIARHNAKSEEYPPMDAWVYPFERVIDMRNSLLLGCLVGGVTVWVSKTLMSVYTEINFIIQGLTIKGPADIFDTVSRFISDAACGVLTYTVMVFLLIKAFELATKNNFSINKEKRS